MHIRLKDRNATVKSHFDLAPHEIILVVEATTFALIPDLEPAFPDDRDQGIGLADELIDVFLEVGS